MAQVPALHEEKAIKTYRYLRIGMVVAAGMLAASVVLERFQAACWQTSVSAYYYTPARAVFVGALVAIGFFLIVIKGTSSREDVFLNIAGMLAPIVALVPISDVGRCWSVEPQPLPTNPDGSLADWVVANVQNNIGALLIAGLIGLVIAALVAAIADRDPLAPFRAGDRGTRVGLLVTFVLFIAGGASFLFWDGFYRTSHNIAAGMMFAFLAAAAGVNAWERRPRGSKPSAWYFGAYGAIAGSMLLAAAVMFLFRSGWDHMLLVLEATEIFLFAAFWSVQTREHWREAVAS